MRVIEPVANYQCVTGENPLWRASEGRIYWEDIETGRLFRADDASGQHECFFHGALPVAGAAYEHQAQVGERGHGFAQRGEVLARCEQADRDDVVSEACSGGFDFRCAGRAVRRGRRPT